MCWHAIPHRLFMSGFRPASLTACPPREPPPLFEQEHRNPKELIIRRWTSRRRRRLVSGTFNVWSTPIADYVVLSARIMERSSNISFVIASDENTSRPRRPLQQQHGSNSLAILIKVILYFVTCVTHYMLRHTHALKTETRVPLLLAGNLIAPFWRLDSPCKSHWFYAT